jgi:ABC-type transport system involved in multi-copper enzyme maturation permease subunit
MKLELRRNNIKTYITASLVICAVTIGLLYVLAYAPHEIPDDAEVMEFFGNYSNLFTMVLTLSMLAYSILSSVMQSRFVIEEYKDKRAVLLFSYPVSRTKILFAKLAVVFLFTVAAMIVSNLLAFGIFSVSESLMPLVGGGLSMPIVLDGMRLSVVLSVAAAGIGSISAGIGFFVNRSVPATIVSSMVLVSIISNLALNAVFTSSKGNGNVLFVVSMLIAVAAGAVSACLLASKIKNMEV